MIFKKIHTCPYLNNDNNVSLKAVLCGSSQQECVKQTYLSGTGAEEPPSNTKAIKRRAMNLSQIMSERSVNTTL